MSTIFEKMDEWGRWRGLDARVVVLTLLLLGWVIVLPVSFVALSVITLTTVIVYILISGLTRGMFRGLPVLLWVGAVLILFQLIFPQQVSDEYVMEWFLIKLTQSQINLVGLAMLRVVVNLLIINFVQFEFGWPKYVQGASSLLRPAVRFPLGQSIYLAIMLTLRFVPQMADEYSRINRAQQARGGGIARMRGNPFRKIKKFFPMLVPLFVNSLRKSERVMVAMQSRAWGSSDQRGYLYDVKLRYLDILILLASGVLVAVLIVVV